MEMEILKCTRGSISEHKETEHHYKKHAVSSLSSPSSSSSSSPSSSSSSSPSSSPYTSASTTTSSTTTGCVHDRFYASSFPVSIVRFRREGVFFVFRSGFADTETDEAFLVPFFFLVR